MCFSESVCMRHVLIGLVHFSVEAYVGVSVLFVRVSRIDSPVSLHLSAPL